MENTADNRLIRVVAVYPFTRILKDESLGFGAYIVGLRLILEDDRPFILVNVPYEVAEAIRMINEGDAPPRRQSLFDLLANHEGFRELFSGTLKRVVIDELDSSTGLYTATVEFESDGLTLRLKMIPSHAIFLSLVSEAPIYVAESLVDGEEIEEEFEDEY
ncbi:MAG: DUF151 domain-containing protein [Desulfurococcales archaeon]|nr:DUF151 domain-containing protein [Desulfurococcales archaeon]MEB3789272.1 DUF151 domain-containing protein [Desulfurococcales archaeon]